MGLITGLGWLDSLTLEIRDLEEKSIIPILVGEEIAWDISDNRSCVGSRPPGSKSLIPCPLDVTGIKGSQCDDCFEAAKILPCLRCTGEYCRNLLRRNDCIQDDNHIMYLASFAPGDIKVGVSKYTRRVERLAEQGARAAIIVARDDGQMIRRSETMAKTLGIPDRKSPKAKITPLAYDLDLKALEEELLETLDSLKKRMRAKWVTPEKIKLATHEPMNISQLLAPSNLSVKGTVKDIVGQIIIVDDGMELVAIDGSSLIGRQLSELSVSSGSNYQAALF